MKHAVNPGEKYGKLTIIREVRKVAPSGQSYRAVLCQCDCGNELTPGLRSLMSVYSGPVSASAFVLVTQSYQSPDR